jgi:hypothetical protein
MNTKHEMAKAGTPKANGSADPLGSNSEIGRKLKQYYDDIVTEDVPDRFADLLKQLEDREGPAAARDGE